MAVTGAESEDTPQSSQEGTSNINAGGQSSTANTPCSVHVPSESRSLEQVEETSSEPANCTTEHRCDEDRLNSNENCETEQIVWRGVRRTFGDCLDSFDLLPFWQQLVEFQEEVKRGTKTEHVREECERKWRRLDAKLNQRYISYCGKTSAVLRAVNQTRTILYALNGKIPEDFDLKKEKVSFMFIDVEDVKQALEFAHRRRMDMEMHLERTSDQERKITEKYRDFYSHMERAMGAVVDGEQGADRQVLVLYDRYYSLLGQPLFVKREQHSFYNPEHLHPDTLFQRDVKKLERMFMLAHYVAVKQENARLNNKLVQKAEEENGVRTECEELSARLEKLQQENALLRTIVEQSTQNESKLEDKIVDLQHDIAFLTTVVEQSIEKETELERLNSRLLIECVTKETQTEESERQGADSMMISDEVQSLETRQEEKTASI